MSPQRSPLTTRRFPRVRAERPVLVRLLEGPGHEELVKTRVVGLGGCCFVLPTPIGFCALVELLISTDGGVVRADGRIVYELRRTAQEYEVGVEFMRVPTQGRALLAALVNGGQAA